MSKLKHAYFMMGDDKHLYNDEDIADIAFAVCRKEFDKNNLKAEARDFAKIFDNLRIKEIKNPSVNYLIRNDYFDLAVKLYEDKYNCDHDTAFKKVNKMYRKMVNEGRVKGVFYKL